MTLKALNQLGVLIFILANFNGYSQKIKTETSTSIIWTEHRKLKKSDFTGKKDANTSAISQTGANIIIKPFKKTKGKYEYHVLAKFYKTKSWLETNDINILKHEQLHFDIAELYAREMRKKIYEIKIHNDVVLESDYRKIHKQLFKEYISFQQGYDAQTQHSRNKLAQNKIALIISNKLKALDKFKLNL